ncbi:hypothetical protein H4R35_000105 [Dimargaris xerosporica]|nr:hypothetical protein H4R35_000105 [Dimargaris xerosporica]
MKFFKGLALVAAAAAMMASVQGKECDTIRYRKDLRDCSQEELDNFILAIKKVNQMPSKVYPGLSKWDEFAKRHAEHHPTTHSVDMFITYHRMFLLEMEDILHEAVPGVVVPYWNIPYDADHPEKSIMWQIFGTSDVSGGKANCIPDGPFKGLMTKATGKSDCVRRGFDVTKETEYRFWSPEEVANIVNKRRSYTEFRYYIEMGIHANAHGYGEFNGTLVGRYSPADPTFYLIHSYVEWVYVLWQKNFGSSAAQYPEPEALVPYYNVPVKSILDSTQFCYEYLNPGSVAPTPPATESSNAEESSLPTTNTNGSQPTGDDNTVPTPSESGSEDDDNEDSDDDDDSDDEDIYSDLPQASASNAYPSVPAPSHADSKQENGLNNTKTGVAAPGGNQYSNVVDLDKPLMKPNPQWAAMNGLTEEALAEIEETVKSITAQIKESVKNHQFVAVPGWTNEGESLLQVAVPAMPVQSQPITSPTKSTTPVPTVGDVSSSTNPTVASLLNLCKRITDAYNQGYGKVTVHLTIAATTVDRQPVDAAIAEVSDVNLNAGLTRVLSRVYTAIEKRYTRITVIVTF